MAYKSTFEIQSGLELDCKVASGAKDFETSNVILDAFKVTYSM